MSSALSAYLSVPNIFLLLGAFFTVIGTVLASAESQKEQKEFVSTLREKDDEIIRLSKLNSNLITGGEAYPKVMVSTRMNFANVLTLTLMNAGEGPLYDLKLRITDQEALGPYFQSLPQGVGPSEEGMQRFRTNIDVGSIGKNQAATLLSLPLIDEKYSFMIESSARNGTFYQTIQVIRKGDRWLSSTKLYGFNRELWSDADPEFPAGDSTPEAAKDSRSD